MYKIPANTHFVGKNLVFVPEWHSTNSLAMELGQRAGEEGTVVITDHQHSGRGQRGNRWLSEPGKNLTFSIILKPNVLPDQQFLLTQVISLAVLDYVRTNVNKTSKIKWPNDILIDDKKVCGILLESSLSGSVIQFVVAGIGLNVNQLNFEYPLATSLKLETGVTYDLQTELPLLLVAVESRYRQLQQGEINTLTQTYTENLYRLNEMHEFQTETGLIQGRITGVDASGRLLVKTSDKLQAFDLKSIQFVDRQIP